jgi:cell shape-determining protein MreD
MTFFTSVFEPELLLLWLELWVSKLKSKVSIPEHGLSTR